LSGPATKPQATGSENLRTRLDSLEEAQRATLNILEDFDDERHRMEQVQTASLNILEDFDEERNRLGLIQAALINILEDIEEERTRTERTNALLESVNKELEAFTYSVSHDLRAPLRAVSGFAQAMSEDCATLLDNEGRRYLGLIASNAQRMGQLIDDLLAFSRLGRQQMTKTIVDMEGLARSVYAELTPQTVGRRILFTVLPVPKVSGDMALLHQVLVNLISNAVKFTRTRQEAVIEFGHLPDRDAYYVKDNGVGFEMQYVGKLYGVFQRLHPISQFEGTGVGLALVSRIITRHGGRVWAEGEVDRGARFCFTLPGVVKE
jgi:light-regulated signal transduction histidine kinase (bacteriophytochrome)